MKLNDNVYGYCSFAILFILMLSGCAYKNRNAILKTPYDTDTIKHVYVVNEQVHPANNMIKPEDELVIRNLQDKDLMVKAGTGQNGSSLAALTFKVNANGSVALPLIGNVMVSGLNKQQAAEKIQKAYEKTELKDPIIDVQITNNYVSVLGEVSKQGKYIIDRDDYELIDLLGEAGGLLPTANKKLVKIIRGDRSNPEILLVNINDYNFVKDKRLKLQPRDVIYIEPKRNLTNVQTVQTYASLAQIGLVILNTFLIIYNLSK